MHRLRTRDRGFTFMEMLIAVTIFSVILSMTYVVFRAITTNTSAQREESIGRVEINNALDLVVREIMLVGYNRNKDDIDAAEATRFVYWADIDNNSEISIDNNPANDLPRVEKITVSWDQDAGQLTRSEDQGGTLLLVDDVIDCELEYFDGDGFKIDEDDDDTNGQQITQQKNRDRIRRVRLSLITQPYGKSQMKVTRDISLPNMAVEQLEECGRIAMDAYMTVKACDPPGERGEITVTTYDKEGDRTDQNSVVFSVNPDDTSEFQWDDGSAIANNTLYGTVRDSRETVYFEPYETEAGIEYTISAEWTPAETGCWKRVTNTVMRLTAGDPCSVDFVDAPDQMVVCQGEGYDPGVNVAVAVSDMCDNFVPDAVIQVEIVGNDLAGTLGTIEGSPARPEIRSDQFGKAYFKYRPPDSTWPETITLKATIQGDLASDACDPEVTHVFPLIPNDANTVVKSTPTEPLNVCDGYVDVGVMVQDSCGNGIEGITDGKATVLNYNPTIGNYVTDLNDGTENGIATVGEVGPDGSPTPGVYWFRLYPGNGGFTTVDIGFWQASAPDSVVTLTYSVLPCNGCEMSVQSTPEVLYGSGLPYNSASDDLAKISFTGYEGISEKVAFTIDSGSGKLYTDENGSTLYTPGTALDLNEEGHVDIYLKNDPSNPTAIGSAINVHAQDFVEDDLPGVCVQNASVDIVCSPATLTITNQDGDDATTATPWDPTLSSAKLIATVSDKNLSPASYSTVTVTATTDTGDEETLTLSNGAGGYVFSNGTGIGFDDLKRDRDATDNNGELEPDLIGTVWVTYSDSVSECSTYSDTHTVEAPVDGCVIDLVDMDFEDSPSDSGTWNESFRTFSYHSSWSYEDWERGTPSGVGPSACPEGSCYGTNIDGNYGTGGTTTYQAYLTRETPFVMNGLAQARIVFDMYLDMGSGNLNSDGSCAWIERKINNASRDDRYQTIKDETYNTETDNNFGNYDDCWGGDFTAGEWQTIELDLWYEVWRYQGDDIRLRFSFFTDSDDYESKPGWYIDNLRVCGSTRGD